MSRFAALSFGSIVLGFGASASALAATIAPLPQTPPKPLMEETFCWVAGVDRSAMGVDIYLTTARSVIVTLPDGSQSRREYDPALLAGTQSATAEGPVLHLPIGARFNMGDTPENRCSGTVGRAKDGLVTVAIVAEFIEDGQADSAEEVLYAQPAGGEVREKQGQGFSFHASWPEEAQAIPALRRGFEKNARDAQKGIAKLMKDQRTQRSEAELPAQVEPVLYETTRVAGNNPLLLSMVTDGYAFLGGAHGQSGYQARLWDKVAGKEIESATALFSDGMAVLRDSWCSALDAQRVIRSEGRWTPAPGKKYNDIWDCPSFSTLAIVPMGVMGQGFDRIRIIAAPYIAGPYSDGTYDISFPVTPEVWAQVKPQYRQAFTSYGTPSK